VVIDDIAHLERYYADIVLNQNINSHNLHYRCEPYTRLLLGTKYVLLRREFWPWRKYKKEVPEVAKKVLVTMGGSDPDNVTLKVIRALAQIDIPGLEAVVVVGPANQHKEILRYAAKTSPLPIRLVENAANMPELMAWADIAVSAGGSTVWELLFLGVPIIMVMLAENQKGIIDGLSKITIAKKLGCSDEITVEKIAWVMQDLAHSRERRVFMSARGRQTVDGYGVARIIELFS